MYKNTHAYEDLLNHELHDNSANLPICHTTSCRQEKYILVEMMVEM
jgi:hypothetical protein